MLRRVFVLQGLMLVGFGRRVWAQLLEAAPTYFPLSRPVRISLDAVKIPWQPVMFTAEAMAPATSTTPRRRVLISGVLFRRSIPSAEAGHPNAAAALGAPARGIGAPPLDKNWGRPEQRRGTQAERDDSLSALCLTCPHEQCKVDLVTDPVHLARIIGEPATHPLFECACHLSVFDALQDGARIAGETPRGLYRFRVNAVKDGIVEVNEIEEEALFAV